MFLDDGGSAALRNMAPFCKAGKISLPQLLSPCEFSQQGEQLKCLKLYKVLILCSLIKNG